MLRSTRRAATLVAVVFLTTLAAESSSGRDELATRAGAILAERCHRCHGLEGRSAAGVAVLDRDRLVEAGVVVPGDPRSRLVEAVASGRMPLGGPALSPDEVAVLRDWVLAGAPETGAPAPTRRRITEVELLDRILADLNSQSSRSRPFLRYLSLAHLYNAAVADDELALARVATSRLVNSLSWERVVVAASPIDPERVLLRIDLRDYGWTPQVWARVEGAYPYGVRFAVADAIAEATGARLPYVRADWLVAEASVEPLYGTILGLPSTVTELERLLGVDAARNLEREHGVLRAGVRQSGVSQHNRVVERHVTQYGAYWKSYDFRDSSGARDIFANPVDLVGDGGEMIFNLPNGFQGYYLADATGRRIDSGPIEIVSDRTQPEDPLVRSARSCMGCHTAGVKPLRDDVRPLLTTSRSVSFDRVKALALYVPQLELDAALGEDAERFAAATRRADVETVVRDGEPIATLARRYAVDLRAQEAAAEVGLDEVEFKQRLALIGSSAGVELEGLAVRGGGIKRRVWASRFRDLVSRLGLGTPATTRLSPDEWRRQPPTERRQIDPPAVLSRAGRRILVRTKTKFFTTALLENELQRLPSFAARGFAIVRDVESADLEVVVDRPLFTYTYTYSVLERRSGTVIASGRLTAFNGNVAAPKIAKELATQVLSR